jgi:hypothetical protein
VISPDHAHATSTQHVLDIDLRDVVLPQLLFGVAGIEAGIEKANTLPPSQQAQLRSLGGKVGHRPRSSAVGDSGR